MNVAFAPAQPTQVTVPLAPTSNVHVQPVIIACGVDKSVKFTFEGACQVVGVPTKSATGGCAPQSPPPYAVYLVDW